MTQTAGAPETTLSQVAVQEAPRQGVIVRWSLGTEVSSMDMYTAQEATG